MSNAVYVTDRVASERQVSTWLDRQTHEEFELMAKARGLSRAELLRELVHEYVLCQPMVGRQQKAA